jgi:cytochrome c oxidase subunit 4
MSDHTVPVKTYLSVFVSLIVLTMLTYLIAFADSGTPWLDLGLALGIAVLKATLVVLFFMHVKYSSRLVWLFVSAGFAWLALMILGTLHDYASRGWLG